MFYSLKNMKIRNYIIESLSFFNNDDKVIFMYLSRKYFYDVW